MDCAACAASGRFRNTCEFLDLRGFEFSNANQIHIFQCIRNIYAWNSKGYHWQWVQHILLIHPTISFFEWLDFQAHLYSVAQSSFRNVIQETYFSLKSLIEYHSRHMLKQIGTVNVFRWLQADNLNYTQFQCTVKYDILFKNSNSLW